MTNAAADLVYLDYAATTPVDPRVLETMLRLQGVQGDFGNPSAMHRAGWRSHAHVELAAERLGALLGTSADRLVWTSGATESNNLAIIGAARHRRHRGRHLVTMLTEHKAVTDVFRALQREGFEVSWLRPGPNGVLDLGTLQAAMRADTQLVSIMHVNNETGVWQDIAKIGECCHARGALLHVDAAQSVGKLPLALAELSVDLMSMTAHKLYGPKGIGALYVAKRPDLHLEPLLFGGGQQQRLRPGTLPVPLIAGFGHAAAIAADCMLSDLAQLRTLRDRLWAGISDLPGIRLNGDLAMSYPGLLNVSVADVEGESLLLALEPLCVATGSACNAQNQEPSYVLRALGLSDAAAQGAIRFSIGRPTTRDEIDFAIRQYRHAVQVLRTMSPDVAA
ncbi:MAG: aminotransferase class V-fold PLP-dependent enzyme [Gammaproteobacteria bacterium]|nr:aminotransferase class V-fold PLP-dependent enzyme [Gammaproteobacteria bacterium]MDH5305464.1 aminotransferase class V-fold PLP-dependent enzyme [Gammaproteobacteria bacterium]